MSLFPNYSLEMDAKYYLIFFPRAVLLQPMKEEPPSSAKCRDKFLVQSTIITPERETTSLSDIWGVVEKEDKGAIHEQKIRCAFLPATTAPLQEEEENGSDDVSYL